MNRPYPSGFLVGEGDPLPLSSSSDWTLLWIEAARGFMGPSLRSLRPSPLSTSLWR